MNRRFTVRTCGEWFSVNRFTLKRGHTLGAWKVVEGWSKGPPPAPDWPLTAPLGC